MLLAAVPSLAGALDANSARAFVQKLYSHYPQKEGGASFEPTDKNATDVFDPGMVAAFREDTRLAKGEVGFVDADPICMCQDDSGLKPKIVSVKMTGAATAEATVDLQYDGGDGKPNLQTFKLVVVKGQWRIYDIESKADKSYRDDLMKANARHAKGDWAHD
jgi:hypothetical protein